MTQIPLSAENRAPENNTDDGTHEVRTDVAYLRTMIVNVIFYGQPNAGDRGWVLIDAGVIGSKSLIKGAAEKRFGDGAGPLHLAIANGAASDVIAALLQGGARCDQPNGAGQTPRDVAVAYARSEVLALLQAR